MSRAVIAAVAGVLAATVPQPALADQFTIRSGSAAGDDSGAHISIAGDGFSLLFGGDSTGSVSSLGVAFCGAWPCTPESISFNHRFSGHLGSGSGSIGGTVYNYPIDFEGIIDVTGAGVTVRTRFDGWTVAEGPFTFTAWLDGSSSGAPLFSHTFAGRGTAAALWAPDFFDGARLTFEDPMATPEPSTLMLVGLGVAALARRRKRSLAR